MLPSVKNKETLSILSQMKAKVPTQPEEPAATLEMTMPELGEEEAVQPDVLQPKYLGRGKRKLPAQLAK